MLAGVVAVPVGVLVGSADVAGVDRVALTWPAGASLVQAYTAFIYEGPGWARRVLTELAASRSRRETDK